MTQTMFKETKTDEQLAFEAQNGDENALNQLFYNYKNLVTTISRSYFLLGGDIEDTIQEGMIGLYKAIINFSQERNSSFKTFAVTCIKHQILSAIKIATSQKNMVLSNALPIVSPDDNEDGVLDVLLSSNQPRPDETIIADEQAKELSSQIKKILSPLESKVLTLYLKGFSYKEIAEMSNLTKKSIGNALTRIKNKLQFIKKEK